MSNEYAEGYRDAIAQAREFFVNTDRYFNWDTVEAAVLASPAVIDSFDDFMKMEGEE